jgi:hypothetical protein
VLSGEATHTNIIVFGLTRDLNLRSTAFKDGTLTFTPGLEPTIYCIQGGHANRHTTDDPGLEPTIYCIQGGTLPFTPSMLFYSLWFDPGLEPTIYCIEGRHANLHTTDAVL